MVRLMLACARRAAGDDQRWFLRRQPQPPPGSAAGRLAVQGGDFPAHRHADPARSGQPGVLERYGHPLGQPGPHPVGQAGPGVGFVDHDRHPAQLGRNVHGRADITAHAHHDVGLRSIDNAGGLAHRRGKFERQLQQVERGPARQRHAPDGGQFIAGRGHQAGLHAGGGADGEDAGRGGCLDHGPGDGQQRADVSRRAAAGQDRQRARKCSWCGWNTFCSASGGWVQRVPADMFCRSRPNSPPGFFRPDVPVRAKDKSTPTAASVTVSAEPP